MSKEIESGTISDNTGHQGSLPQADDWTNRLANQVYEFGDGVLHNPIALGVLGTAAVVGGIAITRGRILSDIAEKVLPDIEGLLSRPVTREGMAMVGEGKGAEIVRNGKGVPDIVRSIESLTPRKTMRFFGSGESPEPFYHQAGKAKEGGNYSRALRDANERVAKLAREYTSNSKMGELQVPSWEPGVASAGRHNSIEAINLIRAYRQRDLLRLWHY